ncbi:hypothetical protein [Alkaliflexus imshenetskii]|uniref:hypothetical protein n=1 Tax=Alkaliflexus imshenetskii TaxID=286730 RepID=UPI00047C98C1|nr:hypothetical protein [Alkaliflexus imshenetskii]
MNLFKTVAIATAILFAYLAFQMFFMSAAFIIDIGLMPSDTTLILARRVAMFMMGLSVLMFATRNLPHSDVRQFICLAAGLTLFGLACAGSYEFIRGTVNNSILIAISIETILWVSYAVILFRNRNVKLQPNSH